MATTLADALRGQPDEELAALLRLRPDLVVPVPPDLTTLAARAASRGSVTRVIDQLDRFHLQILDALRLTRAPDGLTSLDQVLAITAVPPAGADPATVRAVLHRLRAYLLVYGPDRALRLVATVDEVLGAYPGGLGRPAAELDSDAAALVGDPARLRRTLLSAPPAARAVLERLAAGPPVGTIATDPAEDSPAEGSAGSSAGGSPATWLVSHGLLVATSKSATETTVELPREVGLLLRRDTGPLGALVPAPPAPAGAAAPTAAADAAGAGQAMEIVRLTAALLEALAAEPAPVPRPTGSAPARRLRTGPATGGGGRGMGIRDLRRLARAAGLTEPVAALLVETAHAAGLIGEAEAGTGTEAGSSAGAGASASGAGLELRPAAGYDAWTATPLAARWYALVTAWLAMTRQPGLVGQRDTARIVGPLSPEVERSSAPTTRQLVLTVLAGLPPGTAPTPDETLALVDWHAPRRASGRSQAIRELLSEAATLGLLGRGAVTSYGAALLAELTEPPGPDDDPLGIAAGDAPAGLTPAAAALDALLPAPVAEVLVQADLTVVVPGPPEATLAAELELVTEHESTGGASVRRVTRDSLRRALDAGYAAEDLHALFGRRSRTAVPQALSYLVDDVARAHGGLRVGSSRGYLRSDDEALVVQVLADRRLAHLGLRRLAPTVLVSAVASGRLLAALREAGYAPVPEDASGAAVLVRPGSQRAPAQSAVALVPPLVATRMSTPRLLGIVEDIRRGDAAARAAARAPAAVRPGGTPAGGVAAVQAHTEAMAVLQQAVRDKVLVWVGYVDSHGATTSRLLRPVSIGAGYLRAEDERTDTLHTFALHRITGAALD